MYKKPNWILGTYVRWEGAYLIIVSFFFCVFAQVWRSTSQAKRAARSSPSVRQWTIVPPLLS